MIPKFKAKEIDSKKWVYGTGVVQVEHNTYDTDKWELVQKVNYDELDYYQSSYETKDIDINTLCQSTGLFDKEGNEIFVGDILIHQVNNSDLFKRLILVKPGKVEITFVKKNCKGSTNWSENQIWHRTTYQGLEKYGKVIGNIYDNPELLEELV